MSETEAPSGNAAFELATAFFRELHRRGTRHVVISPGSRSTPLTLAAAAHPGLEKHVMVDERSAGFAALGIGKSTALPAVLVCTSGTALANYYPAVIEARMSGTPLLLATADRPPRLLGTGANQTIWQKDLYGGYPVLYLDMMEAVAAARGKKIGFGARGGEENSGNPGGRPGPGMTAAAEAVEEAFSAMRGMRGPVHLNFPFDKPLEPSRDRWIEAKAENARLAGEAGEGPAEAGVPVRDPVRLKRPGIEGLPENAGSLNTLLIAGPLSPYVDPAPIRDLAGRLNAPVIDEAGLGAAGSVGGFEGFLRDGGLRDALRPELILRFGYQPVAKAVEYALKAWEDVPHLHIAHPSNTHDATGTTGRRVEWHGREAIDCGLPPAPAEWTGRWKQAEKDYAGRRDRILAEEEALTDLHLYGELMPKVPDEWFRFVSNSFPVRDRMLAGPPDTPRTFVNRGASGIDGITSTALGIGLAGGRPGILFTGDLAFLHDANALLAAGLLKQPLLVVIANNSGGSIFRMLPVSGHSEVFTPYFETPQQANIRKLAEAYDLPFRRVESLPGLRGIDPVRLAGKCGAGISLLECVTDAGRSMAVRDRLWGRS